MKDKSIAEQLKPYLEHKVKCSFHNHQQHSNGLDGQTVDCNCGLVKKWKDASKARDPSCQTK